MCLVNRDISQTYADYAESLLKLYVTTGAQLYGGKYVTINVHNLIHLANDVRKHGSLDDFSTFPFENKLQKLKNLLRKSGKSLQQVVRRLQEIETARTSKVNSQNSQSASNTHLKKYIIQAPFYHTSQRLISTRLYVSRTLNYEHQNQRIVFSLKT